MEVCTVQSDGPYLRFVCFSPLATKGAQDSQPCAGGTSIRSITFHGRALCHKSCGFHEGDEGHMALKRLRWHHRPSDCKWKRKCQVLLHYHFKKCSCSSTQANRREGSRSTQRGEGCEMAPFNSSLNWSWKLPLGRSGEDRSSQVREGWKFTGAGAQWGVSARVLPSNSKGTTCLDLPLSLLDHAGPLWALSVGCWQDSFPWIQSQGSAAVLYIKGNNDSS